MTDYKLSYIKHKKPTISITPQKGVFFSWWYTMVESNKNNLNHVQVHKTLEPELWKPGILGGHFPRIFTRDHEIRPQPKQCILGGSSHDL